MSSNRICGLIGLAHHAVNHFERYVDGEVHTIVSRMFGVCSSAVSWAFHKVIAKYPPRYLDEFSFRFNNRDQYNLMDRVLTCF